MTADEEDGVGRLAAAARNLVAACERLGSEQRVQERADIAARVAIEDLAGAAVGTERDRQLRTDAADKAARWALQKKDDVRAAQRYVQRSSVHMANVLRIERAGATPAEGGERQTGRTQRMLEAAVAAIRGDEPYVFVVAASRQHAEELAERLASMVPGSRVTAGSKVYLAGGGQIAVETAHEIGLQWATGRHRGFVSVPVYADHYAIEQACGWALDQHARWGGREQRDGRAELVEAIGELLSKNGCDCECGHDAEGHDGACERCLGCRIEELLR